MHDRAYRVFVCPVGSGLIGYEDSVWCAVGDVVGLDGVIGILVCLFGRVSLAGVQVVVDVLI